MQRRARTPDEQTGSQAGLPLTRVSPAVDRTYWYLDCICGMRLQLHEASQRSAHTQMLAVEEKAPKKARALTYREAPLTAPLPPPTARLPPPHFSPLTAPLLPALLPPLRHPLLPPQANKKKAKPTKPPMAGGAATRAELQLVVVRRDLC